MNFIQTIGGVTCDTLFCFGKGLPVFGTLLSPACNESLIILSFRDDRAACSATYINGFIHCHFPPFSKITEMLLAPYGNGSKGLSSVSSSVANPLIFTNNDTITPITFRI